MSFKDFVLDFFFPPRCAFCGAILEKSGDGVCETCRKALPRTADTERKCDFVRAYTAPFYYEPPGGRVFSPTSFATPRRAEGFSAGSSARICSAAALTILISSRGCP